MAIKEAILVSLEGSYKLKYSQKSKAYISQCDRGMVDIIAWLLGTLSSNLLLFIASNLLTPSNLSCNNACKVETPSIRLWIHLAILFPKRFYPYLTASSAEIADGSKIFFSMDSLVKLWRWKCSLRFFKISALSSYSNPYKISCNLIF